MVYLTWHIEYSGIYLSQVLGVARHLTSISLKPVYVVSFIPYPTYWEVRNKIKKEYAYGLVLPMIPRSHWWPLYALFLAPIFFLKGKTEIISRGSVASQMALLLRRLGVARRVVLDGRGAERAEWTEYDIVKNDALVKKVGKWESEAVNNSDFRLGVSQKLIEHWRKEYQYKGKEFDDHVVVPCTVNTTELPDNTAAAWRTQYNYSDGDIILVYAGSHDNWQSFDLIDELLLHVLNDNNKIKVLILAKLDLKTLKSCNRFPDRFTKAWVSPAEVPEMLSMCDYGLLIREDTVTNNVASPTKFAEYLAAGLKVIISPRVGDFSQLVVENNLGLVAKPGEKLEELCRVGEDEKVRIGKFAQANFVKAAFNKEYNCLLGRA